MKPPRSFLAIALVLLTAAPLAAQTRFLSNVEDLPLMPGLQERVDAGLVFAPAQGRIVEAYAEGVAAAAEVLAFYEATLPQLGWQALGGGVFLRDGERLEIVPLVAGGATLVRFTLRPA